MHNLRKEIQSMIQQKDLFWIRSMEGFKKYCGCHQIPQRSFFLKDHQLPLCARCTGIALGHVAALAIAPFHRFQYTILVLIIPMAMDGTVQYFTTYRSNNVKRVVTGFLYGFALMSSMIHTIFLVIRFIRSI